MLGKCKRGLYIALVVIILVTIDLITKLYIEANYNLGEGLVVIPGFFNIVFIKNTGAAFGMFSSIDSQWLRWGFVTFIIIAIGVVVVIYRSLEAHEWTGRVSLVMIGSGAVGNLIDRLRSGAVTDFLSFYIDKYHWPVFNVADSLITVGVVLLAYATLILGAGQGTGGQEPLAGGRDSETIK